MKVRSILLGSLLLTLVASTPVWSQWYPQKAFDATYDMQGHGQTNTFRSVSDGKGHTRVEIKGAEGRNVTTIADVPNKTMVMIMEDQHMIMRVPFRQDNSHQIIDAQTAKAHHATLLGIKVIDGHPCHGWQYSDAGRTSEVWTGDDIGNMVLMTAHGPDGDTSMHLRKYSGSQPDPGLFVPPTTGYRTMDMPMMGGAMFGGGGAGEGSPLGGGQNGAPSTMMRPGMNNMPPSATPTYVPGGMPQFAPPRGIPTSNSND